MELAASAHALASADNSVYNCAFDQFWDNPHKKNSRQPLCMTAWTSKVHVLLVF